MTGTGYERFDRKESPPYLMSYKCAGCGMQRFSTEGSKFIYIGRYKRRICSECVKARDPMAVVK